MVTSANKYSHPHIGVTGLRRTCPQQEQLRQSHEAKEDFAEQKRGQHDCSRSQGKEQAVELEAQAGFLACKAV